jgi:peptidyl-prolyl cis-trans isomerase D
MPFEVFRRHQKKWLAALALLAMIAFTLDLGLFRGQGPVRGNPVIFQADGRDVRADEVTALKVDRIRANQFVAAVGGPEGFFGGVSDEDMVNAYLLDREGRRLGLPASAQVGAEWLRRELRLPTERFEQVYRDYFADAPGEVRCTDTQLLESIGRQLRILSTALLPDSPTTGGYDAYLATPLDFYEDFRAQAERVAARVVAFPALDYIDKVPEPTDEQIRAFFNEHKDRLPDPDSDQPGFKVPRQVRVEYVAADAAQLEELYRARLTDEELRTYYNANSSRFPTPPDELPVNLFAGDPEAKLTPRSVDPFVLVRDEVRLALAGDRARDEIEQKFNEIRREVMDPFLDRYDLAQESNREAREAGRAAAELPRPEGTDGTSLLRAAAERLGLQYELTPPLDRAAAEMIMPIARAQFGSGPAARRVPFADYVFAPRSSLFESFEMSDPAGQRYLGWKVSDEPDRVPSLDEARPKVIEAWKLAQARELARKDAEALADQARLQGGDLAAVAGDRPIITTSEQPKVLRLPALSPFAAPESRPSDIPEIPRAGEALRDALFSLQPGAIQVAPNAPKTVYYVMALDRRSPADLRALFGPIGARPGIEREVIARRTGDRIRSQLEALRAAGNVRMLIPERPGAEGADDTY